MMKKTKVLQVMGSLELGGAESRMMDVYRHLDRQKYTFDFLAFMKGHQFFEDEIKQFGGKVFKVDSPSMTNMLSVLKEIRLIIRQGKYQAVHAHTSYFSGIVMMAAKLEGIPIRIVHARTTGSIRTGWAKKAMIWVGKWLITRFATCRLAISKDAGDYLFGKSEYEVLPNAIDIEKYQGIKNERILELKKYFEIDDDSFVIGQIGRFFPMKNHKFTLEWFTEYRKEHDDAILVFIGDGYLRESIEKTVEESGIKAAIRFTGQVSNVYELIHLLDINIFPSLYEGLGGVVLEAQAAGVPTVMSDRLPFETDLGLGLVTRCSLDNTKMWTKAVDEYRNIDIPSVDLINCTFYQRKYSLDYELTRLYEIYGING